MRRRSGDAAVTGHHATTVLLDGVRLSLGTLTVVPVAPPRTVDSRRGAWAMTLAPGVGVLLGVAAAAMMWLLVLGAASPPLVAALTIGLLTLLTRAMHLDGLADTADGLGSGRPAAEALAVMRKGDIGPFGVVTLVLVLLVQVVALAQQISEGRGLSAVVLALVVSRLVLPLLCVRGIPSARPDGLGHLVAGSVAPSQAVTAATLSGLALIALALPFSGFGPGLPRTAVVGGVVAVLALLAGGALAWWSVRRLGGVTGDVLGACVEVTFTVALVVPSLV